MTDSARSLGRQLARIEKAQRDKGSTPQLGTSSIEDGAIREYNLDGTLKQVIGRQSDGTNTTIQVNGPVPPKPSRPQVGALTEAVQVIWDGQWLGADPDALTVAPLDLARIDVHITTTIDTNPLTVPPSATIASQGWGEANIPLSPGTYYAHLVARTQSGKWSVSPVSESFTPLEIVIPEPSDGLKPTTAPPVSVIEGFDVVYLKVGALVPENPDPIIGYNVYINGTYHLTSSSTVIDVGPLPYDPPTSFRVSALDADGEGPKSDPVSGHPRKIDSSDLAQSVIDDMDANGAAAEAAQATADQANLRAEAADARAAAAQAAADGAIRTYHQPDEPVDGVDGVTLNVGDLWYDEDNDQANRYDGTGWNLIQDNSIAVALAAAAAAKLEAETARQDAANAQAVADAAASAAATAQTSANGNNRIVYSGANPSANLNGIPDKANDTWFKQTAGLVVGQWRHDGTNWIATQIDNAVIANLDTAKLTTAYANVRVLLDAGIVRAEMIEITGPEGLRSKLVNAGVLVANEIYTPGGIHLTKPGSLASIDHNATDGSRYYDSTGALRISLPMDPSADAPYLFDGQLIARTLLVKGKSTFEGTNNEVSRNSKIVLQKGTTPPTSAPNASTGTWTTPAALPPIAGSDGIHWDAPTNSWLYAVPGVAVDDRPRVARVNATTGAVTFSTITGIDGTETLLGVSDLVKIGTEYSLLVRRATGPQFFGRPYDVILGRLNSSFAVTEAIVLGSSNANTWGDRFRLASDGTRLWYSRPDLSDSTQTMVRGLTVGATLTTYADVTIAGPAQNGQLMVGNFDFGSRRFLFVASDGYVSNELIRSFNGSGVAQPAENFQVTAPDTVLLYANRMGWDGTRFTAWYSSYDSDYIARVDRAPVISDPRKATLTLRAAISWYNPTGGLETPIGPISPVTLPARTGTVAFTAPAPQNDGTANAPSSTRLYLGLTDATLKLQAGEFVQTKLVTNPVVDAGSPPKTTNTFPDGVAAMVQAAAGSTFIAGDGRLRGIDFGAGPANQIAIDALGNGRVGPMNFTTTLSGYGSTTGNMGGTVLGQLGDGVSATDAVNKRQLDAGGAKSFARRRNSVAQLTGAGSYSKVLFQTAESTHPDISYNASNGHFTINAAGLWVISAEITFDAIGTGFRQVVLFDSASNVLSGMTQPSYGTNAYCTVQIKPPEMRLASGTVFWFSSYQVEGSLYLVAARSVMSATRIGV